MKRKKNKKMFLPDTKEPNQKKFFLKPSTIAQPYQGKTGLGP